MNYIEEQSGELEALQEIYHDELRVISEDSPISFSISIRSQASTYEHPRDVGGDEEEEESDNEDDPASDKLALPVVNLSFELPEKYPDVKPIIRALDHTDLEDDEVTELLRIVDQKAEESLGNVMIFIIVSDIVEWLSTRANKEFMKTEQVKNQKIEELEAEERRKAEGTPVTKESFLAWKAKFDAELLKTILDQQKKQVDQSTSGARRLTGREMFERDKALAESDLNFVDDLEQDQLEALMQNIEDIDVDDGGSFDLLTDDDDDGESEELSGEGYNSDDSDGK